MTEINDSIRLRPAIARTAIRDQTPEPELIVHAEEAGLSGLAVGMIHAPYLRRAGTKRIEAFERLSSASEIQIAINDLPAGNAPSAGRDEVMQSLRVAKLDGHLLAADRDLKTEWSWAEVTRSLSGFADAAVRVALHHACLEAAENGWIDWSGEDTVPGLFVMALGKMGAFELNYSSDIDIACFYDPGLFPAGSRSASDAAGRIVRAMTQILETLTADGYVFRVDLRLRPDPRSSNVAVSTDMAELYYQSVGQNWERMVWIKGRWCAGDQSAATAFLKMLEPFVWRRHLDYWTIADIHAIKRQIHSEGGHGDLSEQRFDVKLGRGGIREIEFFAQTQQLILGGRDRKLRTPRTIDTLEQLAKLKVIEPDAEQELVSCYSFLRGLEHRVQMLNDEHTHLLRAEPDHRAAVASLCGYDAIDVFDDAVRACRTQVHQHYSDLFAEEDRLSESSGNLVFTGVEDDPRTVETLERFGFTNPSRVIDRFRGWHRGETRATRTARGRELLTAVTPRLLDQFQATGESDIAFDHFSAFLEGLPSGVQTLSLLLAQEKLCQAIVDTLTVSNKLARDLSRRPDTIDALLQGGFSASLQDDPCGFLEDIRSSADESDLEAAMNKARRGFRDEQFRIGFHLLQQTATVSEAERAYTHLAEQCLEAMAKACLRDTEERMGPVPGAWSIAGFGKLGAGELSSASDLDVVLIFDSDADTAQAWFTRFTQRLITALSAPTEEGELYEIDMQLRPSGRAGPVAVRKDAFERYYQGDAWTWEYMALSRFRPVTGDATLMAELSSIAHGALAQQRQGEELKADIASMRQRLAAERKPSGVWDVKLQAGGLVDIEFVAQYLQLKHAHQHPTILSPKTERALNAAADLGVIDREHADKLTSALAFQSGLQHIFRVALSGRVTGDEMSNALKQRLCAFANAASFDDVEQQLAAHQADVADIRLQLIGPLTTDS